MRPDLDDGQWRRMASQCQKQTDNQWLCPGPVLSESYDWMVNCYYDVKACETDLAGCKDTVEECGMWVKSELDVWYRKWWLTIPLGLLVGVGAGLTIGATK